MILKASERAYGQNLARHLLNVEDNEHVELVELRGFISDDLAGAFKEAEALCRGTKRTSKYLFSLSLNPPEDANATLKDFENAAQQVEDKLGLGGQPRALVLHDKNGRLHAHVVWSRINAETMTAKQLPHFKRKLMDIAHDLYLEHGWNLPSGLEAHGKARDVNYELAEAQQSKRAKRDPEALKQLFQNCWEISDDLTSFRAALREQGFGLARGDRRGFVAIDTSDKVYSLSRWCGVKTRELKARLGDPEELSDIDTVRAVLISEGEAEKQRALRERAQVLKSRIKPMLAARKEMVAQHRAARRTLSSQQTSRATEEARQRSSRFAKGLGMIWEFVSGKRAKLSKENALHLAECQARDRREREILGARQRKERRELEFQIRARLNKLRELEREPDMTRSHSLRRDMSGPTLQ
ncbi:relaxase/mobilization nuclease domain-containing protein [Ponticaulis sp.]|uniref:relaxase/mobilization nuclease domain-containing protein n=1 Tax=Ponticaulis sp. TaxID=2020902 RepID=UPI000B6A1BF4|nr:relaxase/mobilization nuclease domain-containing protein [Ponticaulis sp.]MAJ09869.1 relaxase [Ponticaulis sp.]RPG18483.1 MAG: relaxase [Hyphomonadaceae bacterium TMED125]|tara:strand:+ start:6128 stop:7363 length:1236 start_codon:yes stop_codon:yes gene_type:complete